MTIKFDKMYIISYFGPHHKPELRTKRYMHHLHQLYWAKHHGLKPIVLAMKYNWNDYCDETLVHDYIKQPNSLLLPGPARNILLDQFYKSNDDFAIFADNDTILYDDGPSDANFLYRFRQSTIYDFVNTDGTSIDIICPKSPYLNPMYSKDMIHNLIKAYRCIKPFKMTPIDHMHGSFTILKRSNLARVNLKYHYDYFKTPAGDIINGEDKAFGVEAKHLGLGLYDTTDCVRYELDREFDDQSTWASSTANRSAALACYETNRLMKDLYGINNVFDGPDESSSYGELKLRLPI